VTHLKFRVRLMALIGHWCVSLRLKSLEVGLGLQKIVLCVLVNQWRFYARARETGSPNLSQAPKFSPEVKLRADHVLMEVCTLGPGSQI
jgi:hypothetical protein